MNVKIRIKLSIINLIIAFSVFTCTARPSTINDKKFAASDVCDGVGVIENRMVGGELEATARDEIKIKMIKNGLPSQWCGGLRHVWIGEATYAGYTFKSSVSDPLQFVVDREKGYHYEQGNGTVIMPDGKIIKFP